MWIERGRHYYAAVCFVCKRHELMEAVMAVNPICDDAFWRGPCSDHPDAWDLDVVDVAAWLKAIRTCRESCPFLANCLARRAEYYPGAGLRDPRSASRRPSGVIWAGDAYSITGRRLDVAGLRRLGACILNRRHREAAETCEGERDPQAAYLSRAS